MTYIVKYYADFECEKGHKSVLESFPGSNKESVMCPVCYQEWLDSNIPKTVRISEPVLETEAISKGMIPPAISYL